MRYLARKRREFFKAGDPVISIDTKKRESISNKCCQNGITRLNHMRPEIDYGRRDKGYVFGAFRSVTGEALTKTYGARSTLDWVDFLEQVDEWLPVGLDRVYALVDNLSAHRASDVLLYSLQRPRWEFVFQPKYAAYPNLIEL
jgi:transposase